MFDLAKAISVSNETEKQSNGPSGCSLFYQTQQCLELVKEVCRFEGWPEPDCHKEGQGQLGADKLNDLIIVELNQSSNVVEDARRFASQLPNHKGMVVIGKEDAITTLRSLKEMGFYYLFWPVGKQELTDFLRHVHQNQKKFSGVSNNRKAKRISVVGCRGGVGTSLIATELASALASSGSQTLLVDHKYHFSNIDILLGKKNLMKQDVKNISLQLHELDADAAHSYLANINKHLNLLALTGSAEQGDLTEYTHTLCDLLLRHANFIIEDFSASVDFSLNLNQIVDRSDIVVLVFDPSVSALRNAQQMLNTLSNFKLGSSEETRVLLVANHHRPESAFPLSMEEMAQYLDRKVDVILPYNKQFSHLLLEGHRLHKQESGKQQPLTSLFKLINGQVTQTGSNPLSRFKEVFRR
ncbi:AAA family ATPase [Ferrimonas aestuarii]|uniref:Chromosome partitioning protein ParA n=1 Tax=Ferrimonas aestuarii TaxID=2569539 RepID=A0A4U1BS18_9GAMM|nr:P-loop NTPase [Ferrimonas aestuarii]TKB58477.1 chromosome partitioning protein ParA [Ferrimonas aestuarii]